MSVKDPRYTSQAQIKSIIRLKIHMIQFPTENDFAPLNIKKTAIYIYHFENY